MSHQYVMDILLKVTIPSLLGRSDGGAKVHMAYGKVSTYLHLLVCCGCLYIFVYLVLCMHLQIQLILGNISVQNKRLYFHLIFLKPFCDHTFIVFLMGRSTLWQRTVGLKLFKFNSLTFVEIFFGSCIWTTSFTNSYLCFQIQTDFWN